MSDNLVKKDRIPDRLVNYLHQNWKILIYSACGLGLSWIDLWRGIGNGAQWALAVNCIGFCIFPMIVLRLDWRMLLPGYKVTAPWEKIFRIVFCVWAALFLAGAYPVFRYFAPGTDYDAQIATAVLNIGLYGAVAIRMYFFLFLEGEDIRIINGNRFNKPLFLIWLAFMVTAIVSVNRFIWPLWFFVMFGSLYLAPLKTGELEEIIEGVANGLIIGFFWIQGRAFLYRPYDSGYRYYGHYTNPNVNAMFYLFAYVAWLVKLTLYRLKRFSRRYAVTFLMAASMLVFAFFTGCRSAWLAFAFVTFAYWIMEVKLIKGKITTFIFKIVCMGAAALLLFFPVFACMRYIPALRHHPIWYQAEYSEDKVMAWDPVDSPKYPRLSSILRANLGRLAFFVDNSNVVIEPADESVDYVLHEHMVTYAEDGESVSSYSDGFVPGCDSLHPMYTTLNYERNILTRALGIRYHIYRYVIDHIRFWGNYEPYFSVWITSDFLLGHAHNNILMISYWFGPVAGILFIVIMMISTVSGIKILEKCDSNSLKTLSAEFTVLVNIAFFFMGITECTVFLGELGLTLFFVSLFPVVGNNYDTNPKITREIQ